MHDHVAGRRSCRSVIDIYYIRNIIFIDGNAYADGALCGYRVVTNYFPTTAGKTLYKGK